MPYRCRQSCRSPQQVIPGEMPARASICTALRLFFCCCVSASLCPALKAALAPAAYTKGSLQVWLRQDLWDGKAALPCRHSLRSGGLQIKPARLQGSQYCCKGQLSSEGYLHWGDSCHYKQATSTSAGGLQQSDGCQHCVSLVAAISLCQTCRGD